MEFCGGGSLQDIYHGEGVIGEEGVMCDRGGGCDGGVIGEEGVMGV